MGKLIENNQSFFPIPLAIRKSLGKRKISDQRTTKSEWIGYATPVDQDKALWLEPWLVEKWITNHCRHVFFLRHGPKWASTGFAKTFPINQKSSLAILMEFSFSTSHYHRFSNVLHPILLTFSMLFLPLCKHGEKAVRCPFNWWVRQRKRNSDWVQNWTVGVGISSYLS